MLRTEAALRGDKLHATGRLYSVDSIQFTGAAAPATSTGQSSGGSTGLVQAALAVNAFVYDPDCRFDSGADDHRYDDHDRSHSSASLMSATGVSRGRRTAYAAAAAAKQRRQRFIAGGARSSS